MGWQDTSGFDAVRQRFHVSAGDLALRLQLHFIVGDLDPGCFEGPLNRVKVRNGDWWVAINTLRPVYGFCRDPRAAGEFLRLPKQEVTSLADLLSGQHGRSRRVAVPA
jgi:hypothetical protein